MKNIYIEDNCFGPNWELNPICIRYRQAKDYEYWLKSLRTEKSKRKWLLRTLIKESTDFGDGCGISKNLLRKNVHNPQEIISKITHCKNMYVIFTEVCENYILKSHNDLNTANYLDIKIPLIINDNEFPYINLLKQFMHNNQSKKVLHIDFRDWVHQDRALNKKIKEYYRRLVGNDLHEALNAVDPVLQNTTHFVQQWNQICNIINSVKNREDIIIEIVFVSLVRDKYMTNSAPAYDNILLWCEKMEKELMVSKYAITYMHECYYMDPQQPGVNYLNAQESAFVRIGNVDNTFSNIWRNK